MRLETDGVKFRVMGIDPGKTGAVAVLGAGGKIERVADMPVGAAAFAFLLRELHTPSDPVNVAVVEEVGAMTYVDGNGNVRGQGAKASFTFGFGAGVIQGALAVAGIPVLLVRPAVWKAILGLSRDKTESRVMAAELFASSANLFRRAKDDGRAEAALLAYFGSTRLLKAGFVPSDSKFFKMAD